VFEYAPAEVKLAFAGNGRAEKEQMVRMARALFSVTLERADEADALALAVCHLARRASSARSPRPIRASRPAPIIRPARWQPEVG
jgi:crossover junction endodeoxyribonuclease RuvC